MKNSDTDIVIISRQKLESLQRSNKELEERLKDERLKFKKSSSYCLSIRSKVPFWEEEIYTSSEKVKLVCDSASRILKRMDQLADFWKKPWYVRVWSAFWGYAPVSL